MRGINVGGKRKILMSDLKMLYKELGFSNITTYIQSGNVIFESDSYEPNSYLAQSIEQAIFNIYRFDVPVIVRTAKNIESIISHNPFLHTENVDIERLHLTFLSENPSKGKIEKLRNKNINPDRFEISENNVFVYCSGKYSDSKLTNSFFENGLEVKATTRNWKTVSKLHELASSV